jgi:hypothetical protein
MISKMNSKPNFGAPPAGYIPWRPTEEETAAIKARGVITEAARWDCSTPEVRESLGRPELNTHKRWFEQRAYLKIEPGVGGSGRVLQQDPFIGAEGIEGNEGVEFRPASG